MEKNLSRSSLFRAKMKIEATKKQEESEKKSKADKSEYFYSVRRHRLPEENIGKEPGE